MSNGPNPRGELRQAIEDYQAALGDMHHAENVLARANEMLGALRAKRASFDSLDEEIASARANLIKQALANDGSEHLLTQEPEGFAAAKIARDNLDAQIDGVRDSIKVLEAELANAHRHTEEADFALELARKGVFAHEAETAAREFMQRLMDVRRMSMMLRFMNLRQMRKHPNALSVTGSHFYGDGGMRKIGMPRLVTDAVHEEVMGDFDRRGGLKIRDDIARAVADWWARLRVDPLATFDADEAIKCDPHSPVLLGHASLFPLSN